MADPLVQLQKSLSGITENKKEGVTVSVTPSFLKLCRFHFADIPSHKTKNLKASENAGLNPF